MNIISLEDLVDHKIENAREKDIDDLIGIVKRNKQLLDMRRLRQKFKQKGILEKLRSVL